MLKEVIAGYGVMCSVFLKDHCSCLGPVRSAEGVEHGQVAAETGGELATSFGERTSRESGRRNLELEGKRDIKHAVRAFCLKQVSRCHDITRAKLERNQLRVDGRWGGGGKAPVGGMCRLKSPSIITQVTSQVDAEVTWSSCGWRRVCGQQCAV